MIDKVQPIEIDFEELQLEEVIGVGGFGKVYRYICKLIYKMYKATIIMFYRKKFQYIDSKLSKMISRYISSSTSKVFVNKFVYSF